MVLDGIELLPHPPYSRALAPSDYYIFTSMVHFYREGQFKNVDDIRIGVQEFIDLKPKKLYSQELHDLVK